MLSVLIFAAKAVLPIVLLIVFGFVLRQTGVLSERFFAEANRLMFKFALPMMLFVNIYNIESLSDIQLSTVLFSVAVVTVLFGIGAFGGCSVCQRPAAKGCGLAVFLPFEFRFNRISAVRISRRCGGTAVYVPCVGVYNCTV